MTYYQKERDMSQPNYYDKYVQKPSHKNFWECPYCGKVYGNKYTAECNCKIKYEVTYD